MDLQLVDKIVVITAASSGIGRAAALMVALAGPIPVLVARRTDDLEKARVEIETADGAAYVYPADVTDSATPDRVVAAVLSCSRPAPPATTGRDGALAAERPAPAMNHVAGLRFRPPDRR